MDLSSRRRFLGAAAGAAALSVVGRRPGFAQQFPARGILVIVPYAAGGGSDAGRADRAETKMLDIRSHPEVSLSESSARASGSRPAICG